MDWGELDLVEKIEVVVSVIAGIIGLTFWWLNRKSLPMERWKMIARYGEADLEVAVDEEGHKRVCFCCQWEGDGGVMQEERFLITANRAKELAGMLRIAAARGHTLGVARWHARHDREGPKAASPG